LIEPAVSVFLGFSLAMDALAVSVAMVVCSSLHFSAGPVIRVSGVFGLFQALMPVAGWAFAGRALSIVGGVDHWIAFGLLSFVGGRMILEATRKREECLFPKDPSRGLPFFSWR
jgi:putative Mn2+ efflux pump MntP